ncbi:hypothetical protein H310_14263 [Aphanomyces invadans]|uniref:Uncharacterized protein n=1 Tax=Aphanomyces invadans TaxID=157072 RepID=A0A024TAG0_9STRA|nr:hypothetical protein H310_14263 [Aphanomyces invadans]ETV91023.1 hypothetical protein H310_14263 [Aphanomyces invadans]|eukprot:XP_008880303.1 hypothetical protein H310_14263 [Aphanomyces invadans]
MATSTNAATTSASEAAAGPGSAGTASNPAGAASSTDGGAAGDSGSASTTAEVPFDALETVSLERDGLSDMLRQSEAHVQVLLAKNEYLERQVEVAVRSSVRRDLEIMRRRADLEQEEAAHRARVLRHAAENRVQATAAAAANPSQTPEQTRDPVTGHLYSPAYSKWRWRRLP